IAMVKVEICKKKEFPKSNRMVINVNTKDVVVFKSGKNFYAINKKCTHTGGNLGKGFVNGRIVTCPVHGASFDLETGELLKFDIISQTLFENVKNATVYEVKEEAGILYLIDDK
ncbi:MAG: Rieske (2Fe-2S) protein, partial [Candidatus Hodarchaeota archaeon]